MQNLRKYSKVLFALSLVFVSLLIFGWPAPATKAGHINGTLDDSFGTGGKVTTDFQGTGDLASSVALQPDGKIVVAGTTFSFSTGSDFAIARYNSDGTLDPSFGINGKVTTDFAGAADGALGVAVQRDGKIVVVGSAIMSGTGSDFAIARYNSDGTLDAPFGTDGKVTTNIGFTCLGGCPDSAHSVVLQPDGKIVAAGSALRLLNGYNFALARYNRNGTLDTDFGNDGTVMTKVGSVAGAFEAANSVALQRDGKIVVAGLATTFASPDFAVARFNSDGTIDTSFAGTGRVTTDFGIVAPDDAQAVAVQPDGKIVAAGETFTITGFDFAIARYNRDGSIDTSFGGDGRVTTNFDATTLTFTNDEVLALEIQQGGRIVAAGASGAVGIGSGFNFGLARYNDDGTLDNSFGTGGKVTTDFDGLTDQVSAIALQHDGRIVAAGSATINGVFDFAVARYK